jgi:methionyl-tRNA formyltransferase
LARALFIGLRSPLTAGALAGWLASGNEVAAFWSASPGVMPPRPGQPNLSPAGLLARHGIPNVTVPWLSKWPGLVDAAAATGADVLITCGTQMIVPNALLSHFGQRAVNLHPAMLPEYRGPSPYLPMLLDGRGDSDGGATLHVLTAGIDEGDIIAQERVPYGASGANFTSWYAALIDASYRLMRDNLPRYFEGELLPWPQVGGSYRRTKMPHLLDPTLEASDWRQMLERAGSTMKLAVMIPGRGRAVTVSRLIRTGRRTGEAPQLAPFTLDLDIADARVRLRRVTGLARQASQWRLAWALRSLQL